MKHCGNCANYVWGDKKTPLPNDCITCTTTHVPNGEHQTPSHWKAKPQTNADRIRAMSDEELANWIDWLFGRCVWCDTDKIGTNDCSNIACTDCILKWLKQPVKENK